MRTLIAANWKMHGDASWAQKLEQFDAILPQQERQHIDILICPPALYLAGMTRNKVAVAIGAQNCHHADSGAYTGEISAAMLKDIGASYVIVGHSERRAAGETDEDVKMKAAAACQHGLIPIICVGETLEQRESGEAEAVVALQLAKSVPEDSAEIVIAYEPIWAIGTGKVPTISDIEAMHSHIRELTLKETRLLYGGSVKPSNAKDILSVKNVNGALIGGASLEMNSFAEIVKSVQYP